MAKSDTAKKMGRTSLILALFGAYLMLFFASYSKIVPRVYPGLDNWYYGFANGFFAVPTIIRNIWSGDDTVTIFQAGAYNGYQVSFIVGFLVFAYLALALIKPDSK